MKAKFHEMSFSYYRPSGAETAFGLRLFRSKLWGFFYCATYNISLKWYIDSRDSLGLVITTFLLTIIEKYKATDKKIIFEYIYVHYRIAKNDGNIKGLIKVNKVNALGVFRFHMV